MIEIYLNSDMFVHDIFALVKAFYPGEEVKVARVDAVDSLRIVLGDGTVRKGCIVPADPELARIEAKNIVKRQVYRQLNAWTGRELPWGTLTGIRPTKIALGMLEQGNSSEEIRSFMSDTYFTSEEKINLSIEIACREKRLLEDIDYVSGYSLYIGVPFCPTTCLYCSFTSFPVQQWQAEIERYIDTVLKEVAYIAAECGREPDTVYIGGGTPTTLSAVQLDRLLSGLYECYPGFHEHVKEFTVEAGRPDSITADKLEILSKHGVQRISINPQTMNQKTLDLIGRRHTTEQVKEAFDLARACGFDNINMDLIVGLPGESYADVAHTLAEIEQMKPDSLTVHSLAIKRAAALSRWGEEAVKRQLTNTADTMKMTSDLAGRLGLLPYYLYRQKNMAGNFENVGYAEVDKAGIYNILIMEEKQTILAAGAGASSKFVIPGIQGTQRAENVKDIRMYMDRIDEMIDRKRRKLYDYKST